MDVEPVYYITLKDSRFLFEEEIFAQLFLVDQILLLLSESTKSLCYESFMLSPLMKDIITVTILYLYIYITHEQFTTVWIQESIHTIQ